MVELLAPLPLTPKIGVVVEVDVGPELKPKVAFELSVGLVAALFAVPPNIDPLAGEFAGVVENAFDVVDAFCVPKPNADLGAVEAVAGAENAFAPPPNAFDELD